ncbi:MAG: PTS sugar transporter subunit IIB [Desulfuromonadales bacterium]|nr:PTS sugar transporter subunit IIB [Desulfuromonadales bacterium]
MGIVLTRIDNRLIHGQVLEAWVPSIRANCIVVANDQVAGGTFQRVLMETAVPRGIRVKIVALEELRSTLESAELNACRTLLLFASAADALQAHRLGVNFDQLNLGNMHGGEGKLRLSCTIALDPEDIEHLRRIEEEGVRISSQCIPSDRQQDWRKLIRDQGK